MIQEYIKAAMRHAKYEVIEDDGSFYGFIPECPGAWANHTTLEGCRDELESVLEDWILIGIAHHQDIPVIDGLSLNVTAPVHA